MPVAIGVVPVRTDSAGVSCTIYRAVRQLLISPTPESFQQIVIATRRSTFVERLIRVAEWRTSGHVQGSDPCGHQEAKSARHHRFGQFEGKSRLAADVNPQ
jgi:hypothetical protein